MEVIIYCDGSSDGKSGGKGGWAFVALEDGVKVHEQNGTEVSATNNSVEIIGAIKGLSFVRDKYCRAHDGNRESALRELPKVILRSDSQLVLGYASGRYRCKALHLLPLYLEVRKLYTDLKVVGEWVKGHSGDTYNEVCDKLAKAARVDEI